MSEVQAAVTRRRKSTAQQAKEAQARARLLQAAASLVQEVGFERTTVAAIAAGAGVAHGTFYLHFKSRQEVFEQLLHDVGSGLVESIGRAIGGCSDLVESERRGLEANLAFSEEHPFMHRLMAEAEQFAPASYQAFMGDLRARYVRSLRRYRRDGALAGFGDGELDALAVLLMGMRRALIRTYALTEGRLRPAVIKTYLKVVEAALGQSERTQRTRQSGRTPR